MSQIIRELRRENAERRTAATAAETAAADARKLAEKAALDKATADGDWKKVIELAKQSETTARTEADALKSRVAELEPYKKTVADDVARLKEKHKANPLIMNAVDGLDDARALGVLRAFDGTTTTVGNGPGATRPSTNGNPAPTTGQKPIEQMSEAELNAHLKTLPRDQLLALNAQHNGQGPAKRIFER
jgi:hypothetical protein